MHKSMDSEIKSETGIATHSHGTHSHSSGLAGLLENRYVFATALFASLGGVLFGYDQGVISGVQEMQTFVARFPMTSVQNGMMVSILELGAWVGSLIVGYFADKISRKYSIVMFAVIFLLGSAIQGGAQDINYLFGGRFVTGMAVGGLSMLVPLYQSEIATPAIRGSLVSLQQQAITFGVLISFWIDYGFSNLSSEAQWRVPLCLQLAIGFLLAVGILFFPFSPRWLMSVGREQEALAVLSKLRCLPANHTAIQEEWRDIKVSVEFECRVSESQNTSNSPCQGLQASIDLFRGISRRLLIACTIMFFQQFSGINALIYYAPKIFQSVGLTGKTISLLATGVIGIINFVCTIPTVLFLDLFGRRPLLLISSAFMTICMLVNAVLVGLFANDWPSHTTEGWVCVAFVYLFVANFAYAWGPVGWVYAAEIFPLRARAKAMSISTSANWMCNFIIGLITPSMLSQLGYGTYIFFGVFCFLSFVFVWFFVPETKGRSLEDMDAVFGGSLASQDAALMAEVQKDVANTSLPDLTRIA